MDVYQMDPALFQEGIQSSGHRPGGHGLPGLEDLILAGIAEVGYNQIDAALLADIQELEQIDQIPISRGGLDYCHLIVERCRHLGI